MPLARHLLHAIALVILGAIGPTTVQAQTAQLRGLVHDSLTGAPLAGALVQLQGPIAGERLDVPPSVRAVTTDEDGHFRFDSVTAGHYLVGFFHERLDALGLDPILRSLDVRGRQNLTLAIPSPAGIRRAACGDTAGGLVIGFVREAGTRAPRAATPVEATWIEVTLDRGRLTQRAVQRRATTAASGWFALCDLPRAGMLQLRAGDEAHGTDAVMQEMGPGGLLERTLLVPAADTAPLLLTGQVRRASDGRPVVGATVRLGEETATPYLTRTGPDGRWALRTPRLGSTALAVRAVGFYPELRPVEVTDGVAPQETTLASMQAVLDTVKITANYAKYRTATEFEERRRTMAGRFLTARDIDERQPLVISDLFSNFPGLFSERDALGQTVLRMRGIFTDRCQPAVYVNGFEMLGFDTQDLDTFLRPPDVMGVEVYSEATVPVQFKGGLRGCGALVFWTR